MQALYETVKEVIASGRVGVPVFVRCLVQFPADAGKPDEILARVISMASSWLNASPMRLYVQSGHNSAYINATIHYAGGQTAVVAASISPDTKAEADLMLLGNKGGIYHENDFLLMEWDIEAEPVPESLKVAIGRSIETGRPVVMEEEGSE